MILHALHKLYDRLEKDDAYDVAPEGYSMVSVSFLIEIDLSGQGEILDHRVGEGINRRGRNLCVPGAKAHTNAIDPFPFRDTSTYLLGSKMNDPKPENTRKRFQASRDFHAALAEEIESDEAVAVAKFLAGWNPSEKEIDSSWLQNSGVFKIRGRSHYLHESPEIDCWWKKRFSSVDSVGLEKMCLVTGETAEIALTHTPPIGGSMPSPAKAKAAIVSFNFSAADSYGKNGNQGLNSPVSVDATAKYCKSLNALLSCNRHRFQIGDATTIFWTETPALVETVLAAFLGGDLPDESASEDISGRSSQATNLLTSLYSSIRSVGLGGEPLDDIVNESDVAFYILGLTGQAGGRVGVRYWHQTTVLELVKKLAKHHADLAIVRRWDESSKHPDPEYPLIQTLLEQTARESKGIPPNLGGSLMRAIFNGTDYPVMLPERVISRIRVAEKDRSGKPKDRVTYLRAAILKAFLTRNQKLDMDEALDKNRPEAAYHLGRLFAVFETAQRHAHGWKLDRTIRETMYSSASATPLAVFGRLERLHHHHTAKKTHPNGSSDSYADIVSEISQHFREERLYPATLDLVGQSLFSVGYYHQLHQFRTFSDLARDKKQPDESNTE